MEPKGYTRSFPNSLYYYLLHEGENIKYWDPQKWIHSLAERVQDG